MVPFHFLHLQISEVAVADCSVDTPDIYDFALLYEEQHADFTEDFGMYRRLAKHFGGPVLELGVGHGRVAHTIAKDGIPVVGMDLNPHMVERANNRAREKGVADRFIALEGDIRHIEPVLDTLRHKTIEISDDYLLNKKRAFNLVIFPFNSICHMLTINDLRSLLDGIRACLKPGGAFVPSWFLPTPKHLYREPDSLSCIAEFYSPSRDEDMVIWESAVYNPLTQLQQFKWYFDDSHTDEMTEHNFTLRPWFPQELIDQIGSAGFKLESLLGDYTEHPASPASIALSPVCILL